MHPPYQAEEDDEQGLDGVDDEGEERGVGGGDAIEHHHGDDGKVPRTGTVGGGHQNGKGSGNEHHKTGSYRKLRGEAEAEEGEVEMEVVTEPDTQRVGYKEGHTAYTPEGEDTLPHIEHDTLDPLVEAEHTQQVEG